jgi:hypothetical protein
MLPNATFSATKKQTAKSLVVLLIAVLSVSVAFRPLHTHQVREHAGNPQLVAGPGALVCLECIVASEQAVCSDSVTVGLVPQFQPLLLSDVPCVLTVTSASALTRGPPALA